LSYTRGACFIIAAWAKCASRQPRGQQLQVLTALRGLSARLG